MSSLQISSRADFAVPLAKQFVASLVLAAPVATDAAAYTQSVAVPYRELPIGRRKLSISR